MISSWIFGSQDEGANESSTPPPAPQPVLDPEEVRKRRLNNAQLTASSSTRTGPVLDVSPDIIGSAASTSVNSTNNDSNDTGVHSSPKRVSAKLEPNSTTPQDKKKTRPQSSPINTDQSMTSSPTPAGAKADRYSRTLNLVLEFIFQITVRKESGRANIKFMDTEGDSDFLNVDNLEYLLPMRLMEVVQEGVSGPQQGSPCYLIRAYKRLLEKENQALKGDPLLKDLQRYPLY